MKKRYGRIHHQVDDQNRLTQNIHRVLLSFQHAATTSSNVAAFRMAGIILDPKSVDNRVVLRAYVDRSQAKKAIQYFASPECAEADRISAGFVQVPLESTNQQPVEAHDPLEGEIGEKHLLCFQTSKSMRFPVEMWTIKFPQLLLRRRGNGRKGIK